ncbi:MAG: ATP-binding cassette domain-containing protein [Lachnospiraceae bacterium]|nr:ATP-binding cassette domain-containing protein [Lachnospiraceae bacterium]
MIRISKLHKYYNKDKKNEEHVLSDINLEFDRTGLVCILGESGSGKTTLLNVLGGLDTFSDGEIEIDGTVLTKRESKQRENIRNDRFDYIFQNYYLLQDYSVAYNVKLALNRFDLSEEEKEQRVDYVLNMLGIGKYKKKLVSKLSGGQQQRVSIARALVKAPDIILADEPTGNLDEENTIRTMSILKSISKECLVVLVTHEKRIAKFFADRIIEIRDGKILKDEKNIASATYERSDDANIYLKEMDCATLENDFARFKVYVGKEEGQREISLSFAWKDGKLYIKNHMGCDVLLANAGNGVQMLDEERPKFDMDDVEKLSYELPKLKSKGYSRLPMREIWRMALENIVLMGRKQAFVIAVLAITAVLLSVTLAEFINTVSVEEESIVKTDSHYLRVDFTKVSSVRVTEQRLKILEYTGDYLDDNTYGEVFAVPSTNIYLRGFGYAQMTNLLQRLKDFSYASYEHVEEEELLYGRMPKKRTEIILDIRIVEQLMESNGVVAALYETVEDYVGAKLVNATHSTEMEVVGISDTGQPNIYCSQNLLLGFNTKAYQVASVTEIQAECPGQYDNLVLAEDEVLIRDGLYSAMGMEEGYAINIGDDKQHTYQVVGTVPDSVGVDYVLSDEGCINVRDVMIYDSKFCYLYIEDAATVEAAMEHFTECAKGYEQAFELAFSVPYELEIEEYKEAHTVNIGTKNLIAAVGVIISVLMVYFTVKSNAASRSEELTVYRLIGISRGSILKAYMLEMIIVTCYTSLPAVLITSGIIKLVSSVPSLEMAMLLPWWSVVALLAVIYLAHIVISVLTVYGIISKPPAALAVKE